MAASRPQHKDEKDELAIIQHTDVDAKIAKRSAAALGYLDDPFIAYFVRAFDRKAPIINRGTFVRTRSIDRLIESVIKRNGNKVTQIVSLGAGTDTRFFNLQRRLHTVRYHEFDFKEVASAKAKVIVETPALRQLVHQSPDEVSIDLESGEILSPTYCLHSKDIRTLSSESTLPQYLDPNLLTIFLSECCLIYMDQEKATDLLNWISNTFKSPGVGIILYEPIGGHDAFGKMMIKNLATRGINLKTLSTYPTLEDECKRLKDCGFISGQDAVDINFAHDNWLGRDELARISRLEFLDEMEEWRLLASHYCLAWGWTAETKENAFEEWKNMKTLHPAARQQSS